MNRAQRLRAIERDSAAKAAAQSADGDAVVVALSRLSIGGVVYNRNQTLGTVAELTLSWLPESFSAMLANGLIEVRRSAPEAA